MCSHEHAGSNLPGINYSYSMDKLQNQLQSRQAETLLFSSGLLPAEPLWKRLPARDEEGRRLTDFMMVIPGLNKMHHDSSARIMVKLEEVLGYYRNVVLFADLNLKTNVLWVSLRQSNGVCIEVAAAIHAVVPQARLVAEQYR